MDIFGARFDDMPGAPNELNEIAVASFSIVGDTEAL
jgi:hypothetical protein